MVLPVKLVCKYGIPLLSRNCMSINNLPKNVILYNTENANNENKLFSPCYTHAYSLQITFSVV